MTNIEIDRTAETWRYILYIPFSFITDNQLWAKNLTFNEFIFFI